MHPFVTLLKNRTVKGLNDDNSISKNMINEKAITISISERGSRNKK